MVVIGRSMEAGLTLFEVLVTRSGIRENCKSSGKLVG